MVEYFERVIKPKIKRKLKELPRELAHRRRKAMIKLEERIEKRRVAQAKRKRALEAARRKAEIVFERAREKEIIKIAKRRGRKAARVKIERVGGLRGLARGMAREMGTIREVYGPPRPKKKGKVKRRKGKKRKSSKGRKRR